MNNYNNGNHTHNNHHNNNQKNETGRAMQQPTTQSAGNKGQGGAQQRITILIRAILMGITLFAGVVGNAQAAASITITSPANNTVAAAPASLTFTSSVSGGGIASVAYSAYNLTTAATTTIGSSTTSPYTVNWTNVPVGKYLVSA